MGYNINEPFYEDEDYIKKSVWCDESGKYSIKEISPDENGRRRFQIVEHEATQEELLNSELNDLYAWFEEYDNQVKQYNRCQRLGIEYDKDIKQLDNQAKVNAERITEIREILNQNANNAL